jgi:hypothetical protein
MKASAKGALLVFALGFIATAQATTCDRVDPSFVCGLHNAEDLVRLVGTNWIVASHVNVPFRAGASPGFGPIEAVRIDTHEVRRLYPTPESTINWIRELYPDCSSPPESLSSHGLNVRRRVANKFRLFVANHGGRESVEVIDVEARGSRLLTIWRGCILAPRGIFPNWVVPLPADGVALSGGGAAIWRPHRGWVSIDGIEGGNGIEASSDGRWLFIADSSGKAVIRVPTEARAARTILKINFLPDNLRWGEDGRLYVAGIHPSEQFQFTEDSLCNVGFAIARIDPNTLTTQEVFRTDGIKDVCGAASTALQIGDRFWIGNVRGDRLAILSF